MGLGGHLLWTSVIRTLHEASARPVRVCHAPMVTDLCAGRLYCGDVSLAADPVFARNPRIEFPAVVEKPAWARLVDRVGAAAMRRTGLTRAYESLVFALSDRRRQQSGQYDAHIDLQRHSYVARELPDRLVWKTGGHIVDIMLATYGLTTGHRGGEMYFSEDEEREVEAFCATNGLGQDVIVIEPNSKDAWFGDLRAWPIERWQMVVDQLAVAGRCQVVQVGEGGGHLLRHALDLRGTLPVRHVICLMKRARLFLGLEGGLMHAARAVAVPSVIVWGGLTLPEFAGYRESHSVLCSYVDCAPCGLRGGCPFGKKCLTSIDVRQVVSAIEQQVPLAFTPTTA